MPYVVVAVDTSVPWPTVDAPLIFEGRALTLRPGSETMYPTVVLEYGQEVEGAFLEGLAVVRRFLSSLAWTERFGVREAEVSGGGFAVRIGRGRVAHVTRLGRWRCDYLVESADPKIRLALALYREALQLESVSVPYAFLGFFKILNIGLSNGAKQKDWTNAQLSGIDDHEAARRITELRGTHADVGTYLYESGRCAVAHAFNTPVVNPDETSDTLRLIKDLPVAQALAERFIEIELGVKSYHTILSEHLYELEGFRKIVGSDFVARLASAAPPQFTPPPTFPALTVRLDGREDGVEFAQLAVRGTLAAAGMLVLFCVSHDRLLTLSLALDFANERLVFDADGGMKVVDDGSLAAVDSLIMRLRFCRGMVLNGRIEVYSAETGERLGRTDAYVGMNLDLGGTIQSIDEDIAALVEQRARRSAPGATPGDPRGA